MSQESTPRQNPEHAIDFAANPLVPAVITDSASGEVLMVGFMNEEAYRKTRETGNTYFWSRSRNRLWMKGETSGHVQLVQRVSVNCELNSLLIAVNQVGAVCHDGYPSCFYRDIEDDESLTITMDRLFDPDMVYGKRQDPVRIWFEAYEYLKSHALEDVSSTSKLLRTGQTRFAGRVADEMEELAGVLDGSHHHESLHDDLILEGSQVMYWLALAAVSQNMPFDQLRPDRALDTAAPGFSLETAARLLKSEAQEWRTCERPAGVEAVHSAMSIVAQAVFAGDVDPVDLIEHDLSALRSKPYLKPYFAW